MSGRGANRCDICGRFRPWTDLIYRYRTEMTSIYGDVADVEWFECDACTDWKQVPA